MKKRRKNLIPFTKNRREKMNKPSTEDREKIKAAVAKASQAGGQQNAAISQVANLARVNERLRNTIAVFLFEGCDIACHHCAYLENAAEDHECQRGISKGFTQCSTSKITSEEPQEEIDA